MTARSSNPRKRFVSSLVRNPDLLICWKEDRLHLEDLAKHESYAAPVTVLEVLDLFRSRGLADHAVRALHGRGRRSFLKVTRDLKRLGLLLPKRKAQARLSRLAAWDGNMASAFYHVASRDLSFLRSTKAVRERLKERLRAAPQPAPYKHYAKAAKRALPKRENLPEPAAHLRAVLRRRRTVRQFAKSPVSLDDLAVILRETWGRTGWLDTDLLGRLVTKTSPSGGSRHPIECYVIAWNVAGLLPGLYHYDVGNDELRRLRSGNFRKQAVEAASGQAHVGRAAFLCVMTAVFERTLWKYQFENTYRIIWLDAGHLAQTFSLVTTALGLGPFTTAAIQDSYLEKLIGLDGIKEFPVYLCGAGVPAK